MKRISIIPLFLLLFLLACQEESKTNEIPAPEPVKEKFIATYGEEVEADWENDPSSDMWKAEFEDEESGVPIEVMMTAGGNVMYEKRVATKIPDQIIQRFSEGNSGFTVDKVYEVRSGEERFWEFNVHHEEEYLIVMINEDLEIKVIPNPNPENEKVE